MPDNIRYFSIDWCSEQDGPGKRVVVFVQGCSLRCSWCHSPHSQNLRSPLLFFDHLCSRCGRCEAICPANVHHVDSLGHHLDHSRCIGCNACLEACPQSYPLRNRGALTRLGKEASGEELFTHLQPQLELLQAITISGGDPLLQSQALVDLLERCKQSGCHVALESSGLNTWEQHLPLLNLVDCWLFGMRLTTGSLHEDREHMIQKIRGNLFALSQSTSADIRVRIPAIPGIFDSEWYLESARSLCDEFSLKAIDILPHNPDSAIFYQALGKRAPVAFHADAAKAAYQKIKSHFA